MQWSTEPDRSGNIIFNEPVTIPGKKIQIFNHTRHQTCSVNLVRQVRLPTELDMHTEDL